jgi:hypothetical protein
MSATQLGSRLALLAAAVATLALAFAGPSALLAGAGLLVVGLGLRRGSRTVLTLGVAVQLTGVLLAGLGGPPPSALLVAAAGAVLAWDIGEHAIGLVDQLGPDADTVRAELAHALGGTGVGVTAAGAGFLVFRVTTGGQPLLALFLFLLGVLVLVSTLRG